MNAGLAPLACRLGAAAACGWAAARGAAWLDARLDVVLDHGLRAAWHVTLPAQAPRRRWLGWGGALLTMMVAAPSAPAVETAALVPLAGVLFACAWIDWRHHILPDCLVLPLLVTGLTVAAAWHPLVDLGTSLAGVAAGWGVPMIVRLLGRSPDGGLGGGDVKLLAAIGAWVGAATACMVFLVSAAMVTLLLLPPSARRRPVAFGPAVALVMVVGMMAAAVLHQPLNDLVGRLIIGCETNVRHYKF